MRFGRIAWWGLRRSALSLELVRPPFSRANQRQPEFSGGFPRLCVELVPTPGTVNHAVNGLCTKILGGEGGGATSLRPLPVSQSFGRPLARSLATEHVATHRKSLRVRPPVHVLYTS